MKRREAELRKRLEGAGLETYLATARELGAADLYIASGVAPIARLHGRLVPLPVPEMSFEDTKALLFSALSGDQVSEYYASKQIDTCLTLAGAGRFRVNVFRHYRGISGAFRVVPDSVRRFDSLGLPPVVRTFVEHRRGLVLVTGATGSGKTTTLAALIDLINRTRRVHVITIEDPIEYEIPSERSFVSQREIGTHSASFSSALRAALREDPDVIVVGEMRDPETVATAITAAETGHLVIGTLHTHNAYRTLLRILDQFPQRKRAHIRTLLATVLRGVVCQQLVPTVDGYGRCLATEVMVVNAAVSNLIRESKPWQIPMVIQTGSRLGMQLMDDSLLELAQRGKITAREAIARATDLAKFQALERESGA